MGTVDGRNEIDVQGEVVRRLDEAKAVLNRKPEELGRCPHGVAYIKDGQRPNCEVCDAKLRMVGMLPATDEEMAEAREIVAESGETGLGTVLRRSGLAELPAVEPLISGVLSRPAAVVLVGGYGLGKTFLALSFGCSVATGLPWLGRTVEQRRVLFLIGEGAYGLEPRMAAWEAAWNGGQPVGDSRITFLVKPNTLAEVGTWRELTRYAVDGEYGLVILDTFSSLAPDADETKDAALLMRRLSDLATAIDGTALLVHHPGWSDANRSRGGYQIEANADEVLLLNGVTEGSELISLTRKKVKDGVDGAVLWLERQSYAGSVVIGEVGADAAAVPMSRRILAALANYGDIGATGPQLMVEVGVDDKSRSKFYRALRRLREDDEISERGSGQARRYYRAGDAP